MEVGDYVRTDEGQIGKLKELKFDYTTGKRLVSYYTYREVKENWVLFDNKNIAQRFVDGSCYYLTDDELKMVENSIIKSSPNIIDLIEVGDYVNGYEVTSKDQFLGFGNHDWYMTNDEIKSIVTKEQFENMSYKVGD